MAPASTLRGMPILQRINSLRKESVARFSHYPKSCCLETNYIQSHVGETPFKASRSNYHQVEPWFTIVDYTTNPCYILKSSSSGEPMNSLRSRLPVAQLLLWVLEICRWRWSPGRSAPWCFCSQFCSRQQEHWSPQAWQGSEKTNISYILPKWLLWKIV